MGLVTESESLLDATSCLGSAKVKAALTLSAFRNNGWNSCLRAKHLDLLMCSR
jgi:hypothetical protein